MHFVLNGFSEVEGYRVFAFDGVAADRSRSAFTVRIDVALSRNYGIRLQDLPLLCRGLLDSRDPGEQHSSYTYTEDAMRRFAAAASAAAAAARARRPPRRPSAEQPPHPAGAGSAG
ncbi:MAG: hypothetical protein HZB13_09925 [Acidobacteria bacterium]|nr:hypothetical protein [Acidobacteriota bacterium]